jgi:hypothetical protein
MALTVDSVGTRIPWPNDVRFSIILCSGLAPKLPNHVGASANASHWAFENSLPQAVAKRRRLFQRIIRSLLYKESPQENTILVQISQGEYGAPRDD